MSDVKHTPGPWLLRPMSYGYDFCVEGVGGRGCGGWFVELHGGVRLDDTPEFKAEFEANARLMAVAPELLDALKGLTHGLPELLKSIGYTDEERLVEKALAVIAKAELTETP